ncbi:TetR/AcrR family transcriptional regulator [Kribbella monticola]|uniref:TetR/AcrR family transcriptional regulator n=1 Tax=Kribbella monticola TaxID=2185285 RepID=UPI000DD3F9CF|nr:TetR family transcriptional regulator [Kribbella monticola]
MRSENETFIEAARRAQLAECAVDVIAEAGIGKASMARIAERAGVSVGVISYHFGNKAGLISAVVEQVAKTAVALMEPQIVAQPTAAQGLRTLITSNLDFMKQHPNALRALLEIIRADDGVYAAQGAQAISDVEKVLHWGQHTGEFGAFDTRVMATTIRAAIDAVPLLLSRDEDLDLTAYGEELAGLFDRATRKESH